jgi:hypothetical protein
MSEGSQNANANADGENNQENLDAEKLAATNARLLKESQEYKEKYRAALREKEELESKKLAETGDKDALLEAERRKAKKAMDELAKTNKKVISGVVREKVAKYAGDIYKIEDLLTNPRLKEFLKEGLDEDKLDFNDDVAKRYVDEIKKEQPYLWKVQGSMGVNTHRAMSTGTTVGVDTSKMSAKELRDYIASTFKN